MTATRPPLAKVDFFFFFPIPFIIFAPLVLLPLSRTSDPGSHNRLFSPLPTTQYVPFIYIARGVQHFLPSSTPAESCVLTLYFGALDSLCHLRIKVHIYGDSNPMTSTLVMLEDNHQTTGATSIRACVEIQRGVM